MSVALVVKSARKSTENYIPIATEDVFLECWRPGCQALGLKWIPAFQTGLTLRQQDIPIILEELARLREWMGKEFNRIQAAKLHERIDRLVEKLKKLQSAKKIDASIG